MVKDQGRAARRRACAINVQPVATDVDKLAGWGVRARVALRRNSLVGGADRAERDQDEQQSQSDPPGPA